MTSPCKLWIGLWALPWLYVSGCEWDFERMLVQPHYRTYEASPYFEDGTVMQPPPEGAIRFGHTRQLDGKMPSAPGALQVTAFREEIPVEVDRAMLTLGKARFERICATCHGIAGDGNSPVAVHMRLRSPPSLHEARIRAMAPGRIFNVVTEGYGLMPSHAHQLSERARWAVVAYVQVLQLSQHARLAELPERVQEAAKPWLR